MISDDGVIIIQVMYKDRLITDRLKKLASSFPAVVVCGARQVGKSTLVKHIFPDRDVIVFDPVIDIGNARKDPDLFLDNHPAPIILDEIQYAPELVAAIKRRIDKNRKSGQYIITGSQQWHVIKSIAESLAGRAVFLNLEGFSLAEIYRQAKQNVWLQRWLEDPDKFKTNAKPSRLKCKRTLYEQLWRGWLPDADKLSLELIPDFYNSYLQTYIERDIRLISDVSDWQLFGRFIRILAALTAQEINYSQVGRELGLTPQTAHRWIAMFSATFQWFEVPAYSGNTIKRISNKPKGYIADTGFACALQMLSTPKSLGGHPLIGALFETAVVGEIRKLCSKLATPPRMYHWQSHGGAEVDLILERDGIFYPIEVKMTSSPSRDDTKSITAFRKTYPKLNISPGLVICPTENFHKISENDYALPWDTL